MKNGKPKCQALQDQTAPLKVPMIDSTPNTLGSDSMTSLRRRRGETRRPMVTEERQWQITPRP
ncbi:MAG: hypothetical protein EOO77_27060 [Oxalobacteraceae bacterium]|nr:MAG: hypothetical protein EOO77_27060 [Oxalobacteraceae bacterium]